MARKSFGFVFGNGSNSGEDKPASEFVVSNWYTVRCVKYERFDYPRIETITDGPNVGQEYTIDPCHEYTMQIVKGGIEKKIIRVPLGKLSSFAGGINRRSGGDLGIKIRPYSTYDLNDKALLNLEDRESEEAKQAMANAEALSDYLNQCPVKLLYDTKEWVDKDTNEMVRSRPKLLYWVPSDFQKRGPSASKTF